METFNVIKHSLAYRNTGQTKQDKGQRQSALSQFLEIKSETAGFLLEEVFVDFNRVIYS